jgi:hypothetical protein
VEQLDWIDKVTGRDWIPVHLRVLDLVADRVDHP